MNRRQTLASLGALALAGCATAPPAAPAGLVAGQQKSRTREGLGLGRMWVSLPSGYGEQRERWPLVVFLHGSGERGRDLEIVLRNGPPMLAAKGLAYPFVLVSPQLDEDRRWEPEELHALRQALQTHFYVDPDRCLATGLSLGGHGVWDWACAYPNDLAAIAPVCGHGDPARVAAMRGVPVRAYHGDADTVVSIELQRACVDALRAAGGSASFTVYPGVGHGSWVPAYEDAGLVPWLLAQRRHTA